MTKATLVVALACAIGLAPVQILAQGTAARTAIRLPGRVSAEHITSAQLRDYLSFVASDEMEGRDTPSRGLDATAKFIATMLSRWGLSPAGDGGTFFQKIELSHDVVVADKATLSLSGTAYAHGDGWFARPDAGSASAGLGVRESRLGEHREKHRSVPRTRRHRQGCCRSALVLPSRWLVSGSSPGLDLEAPGCRGEGAWCRGDSLRPREARLRFVGAPDAR